MKKKVAKNNDFNLLMREAKKRITHGWVPRRDFISPERRRDAAKWIRDQRKRVTLAIRDRDTILFERALASWEKAFEKLNRICGEAYRARFPDPEEWPLRYFRWMSIRYMELECELGTFYLVPQMPIRKPTVEHWMTADEMLDILSQPAIIKAIQTFGLPGRPGKVEKPRKGEKHMIINFTGDGNPVCYYDCKEAARRV